MNIPLDIVEEILKKLPVKFIIRFKRVCKAWNFLISDPKFQKRYQYSSSKLSSPQRILLSSPSGFRSLDYEKGSNSITRLNFPPGKIVGSSNGLICVARGQCQDFIIWNPSTGDSKNLPDPKTPLGGSFTYGFGYDSSSDDYKIVIATNSIDSLYRNRVAIEVFSLRKNSWTRIRDIIYKRHVIDEPIIDDQVAVTCNGALHWPIRTRGSPYRLGHCSIIAFDLQSEEAVDLVTPFNRHPGGKMGIGSIDGCLCLSFPNKESIEFWVMREHGEVDSWENLFSILSEIPDTTYWRLGGYRPDYLLPLCKRSSGEFVVIKERKELIEVCFKDNTIKKLEVNIVEDGQDRLSQAVVYVESLETPLSDNVRTYSF